MGDLGNYEQLKKHLKIIIIVHRRIKKYQSKTQETMKTYQCSSAQECMKKMKS